MVYFILKHFHYSNFIPALHISPGEEFSLKRQIVFDESCKYDIDEKSCVNKLFGYCWAFGVHENSERFGWRYNKSLNTFELFSYIYNNGILKKNVIAQVNAGEEHTYEIKTRLFDNRRVVYFFMDGVLIASVDDLSIPETTSYLWTLGFYFGGNTRAPHTMHITSKKI